MAYRFSHLSKQNVRYSVQHKVNGVATDPTGDVVEFAFIPYGSEPTGPDWVAGSWETQPGPPIQYVARCLVGPGGGKVLARGEFVVWLRITDSPEVPVKPVGTITIT